MKAFFLFAMKFQCIPHFFEKKRLSFLIRKRIFFILSVYNLVFLYKFISQLRQMTE